MRRWDTLPGMNPEGGTAILADPDDNSFQLVSPPG